MDNMHSEFNYHERKHCWWKFLAIMLATLIGAFLAFYCVVDMTFKRMMNPEHQIKRMNKMIERQERDMMKMERKMMKDAHIPFHRAIVTMDKNSDEYVIYVDLKPFDNNKDNVKITTEGQMITISGEVEKNKNNEERMMSFTQTFNLDDDVDVANLEKKVYKDKYVITIPEKKN